MVAARTTRDVLEAVARAIPGKGDDVVTRVDIWNGWAGAVHVRVHCLLPRGTDADFSRRVRGAVAGAVRSRCSVEIVWASAG